MKPLNLLFLACWVLRLAPALLGQNFQDRFEPNETFAQARALQPESGVVEELLLTIYPTGDVDFFTVTLPAAGRAEHYLEIEAVMSHPTLGVGRVDFALLDAQGNSLSTRSTPLGSGSGRISLENRSAGTYGLKVEGRIGSYGWYNLTMRLPVGAPPAITTHPQSRTVTVGETVTFTVVATGTAPLSYQWRKDGQPLAGQTGATHPLANVQTAQAGSYTVVVSNSAGQITSNPAVLTVNPAAQAPTITTHPQSQRVTAGGTVTFTVLATGTPPLSYQWRKDGQPLAGQTGDTLTLANVQAAQAGSYTVVVSNSAGQATSNPAVLTVNPGSPPGVAERILPGGYVVGVAFTVTLQLSAREDIVAFGVEDQPPSGWTVSNISHGGLFDAQNRKVKWDVFFVRSPADRQQTLTYQVTPPVGATGEATFSGTASFDGINVAVTGDSAISLGSGGNPPVITVHPQSQTAAEGGSVTFSVTATGDPPLSYQWRFNRVTIAGATGPTFSLNPVKAGDAGSYTVVVSNAHGAVTSQPAILTVGAGAVRFTEFKFLARDGFRFKLVAPVGRRYALEASTDLRNWIEIATLDNPTGTLEFTDAEAVAFPRSYYRVRQISP